VEKEKRHGSTRRRRAGRKKNLEEVEVSDDLGVGVLEGYEFVEGHHDEPGVLLLLLWGHELWLCKRNGMRAEAETGSREEGTEAGWARREGEAGVARRSGERPEEVAVVVDGGRHGFHARGTLSSPLNDDFRYHPFFPVSLSQLTTSPSFFFLSVLHFFLLIV